MPLPFLKLGACGCFVARDTGMARGPQSSSTEGENGLKQDAQSSFFRKMGVDSLLLHCWAWAGISDPSKSCLFRGGERNRCLQLLVDLEVGFAGNVGAPCAACVTCSGTLAGHVATTSHGNPNWRPRTWLWWNYWNVFNGAWAAKPSSILKLWESLASSTLDRKSLGVPTREQGRVGGVSVCMWRERGEMAANESAEVSFASTLHLITLQGSYWGRENHNPFIYHLS